MESAPRVGVGFQKSVTCAEQYGAEKDRAARAPDGSTWSKPAGMLRRSNARRSCHGGALWVVGLWRSLTTVCILQQILQRPP